MKLIAITGSPHQDGITNTIIREVIRGAEKKGLESKVYDINSINPMTCQNCLCCRRNKTDCVIDDGLKEYFEDLRIADALIIGGPIYYGMFCGNLISFMNRHYCLSDFEHNVRIPTDKRLIGIVSQKQSDSALYDRHCHNYFSVFLNLGMKMVDMINCHGIKSKQEISLELLQRAFNIGMSLGE